jgi:ATP-binding cassette subfamily B protein
MRVEGIAACVLLVSFAWWAPLLLAGGWTLASQALSRWVQRGIVDTTVRDPAHAGLRRAKYSRSLAMDPLAAKEVRVFGLAGWVVERYASTWQAAMRAIWRERVSNSWQVVFAVVAVTAAHAVVLGVLGAAVVRGEVSLAMLAVYALAVLATERLGLAGDPQWRLARATVAAELLRELAGRLIPAGGPVRPDVRAAGTGPPAAVELRLEAVRFTYRGRERPVLADLDLVVPPGQSLAVVGENGAGKTTLVKLICGLYQPAAGRLVIDGVPLAGSDMAAWRRRVGVIFQDFVRYQLPLRANVGFGDTAITDDAALARALRDAGGADLVEQLPAGWDTVLSTGYDGGVDLSGGQWQKVALARALLAVRAGAGLLILDEPTANLDVTAEAELFDRFLNLTRGVTTILVSHRLSSVRHADRIVLLHDGRIAEDGSHDELLAAGGRYATLFRLQAERFAAAPAGAEAPGDRRNGGGHG